MRHLKTRHYKLVLPGVALCFATMRKYESQTVSLKNAIITYMDQTKVDYTMQDIANIETLYLERYK